MLDVLGIITFETIGNISNSIIGQKPSAYGFNFGGSAGFAGPVGGFSLGGGGIQIHYMPGTHDVVIAPYVYLPWTSFGVPWPGTGKPGWAGFGWVGAVDFSGVLTYNANKPSDFGGPFTGGEITVIGDEGWGDMLVPRLTQWVVEYFKLTAVQALAYQE